MQLVDRDNRLDQPYGRIDPELFEEEAQGVVCRAQSGRQRHLHQVDALRRRSPDDSGPEGEEEGADILLAHSVDKGQPEAATRVGGCFTTAEAEDVRQAYETIFRLRLGHQLARLAAGERPDNILDPGGLSRSDQSRLREAFRATGRLQGKVEMRYFTQAL